MGKLEDISEAIDSLGMTAWGMARAAHEGFTCSVSMCLAYRLPQRVDPLAGGHYDEEAFHQALGEARQRGQAMLDRLVAVLEGEGVRHRTVPSGQDPDTLEAAFSEKRAAVLAGLGWIGKCTLQALRDAFIESDGE
jgi:epoxyqueuosine reductase QueG